MNAPPWVDSGSCARPSQRSGTVCLSSCWLSAPSAGPSPEDGLRHRDTAVCLHLGSGSPSLLHVVVTLRAPAGSPSVWGRDPPKDLFWVTWKPYTGGENRGGIPTTATTMLSPDTASVCRRRLFLHPAGGSLRTETGSLLSFRLGAVCGQRLSPPSEWELLSCATAHL